jgi:uncharacterized protein
MRSTFLKSAALLLLLILSLAGPCLAKCPLALVGSNKIKLEVAQTREQIEHGLMERASMPEDQGMVFLFRPPRPVRFWMFNCLMSLDMLFIKDGKILKISRDVPPYRQSDPAGAPLYPAEGEIEVSEVVEVNAGYCARHGINDGDSVRFDFPGVARPPSGQEKAAAPDSSQPGK